MLDQSFSAYNFERIFLEENRKGKIKKDFLPPAYLEAHEEFNRILGEKNELIRKEGSLSKSVKSDFVAKLEAINKKKERIRFELWHKIEDEFNSNSFKFRIKSVLKHSAYTIDGDDTLSFFIQKQLQKNFKKTFKIQPSNRNIIIEQIFRIIDDGFPKVVLRTDINSFFESISQTILLEKLNANPHLSYHSKKIIKSLLYECNSISGNSTKTGIPRGIGISAFLSELYLREFDEQVRKLEGVIFYARYVDDIVIVFSSLEQTKDSLLENIIEKLKPLNLNLNDAKEGRKNKTNIVEIRKNSIDQNFSYLGYKFLIKSRGDNKVPKIEIELSDDRFNKYVSRIEKSIEVYNNDSKYNEKVARTMFINRLKFLAGNFRLDKSKGNIKSGFFYNNQMLLLDNRERHDSIIALNAKLTYLLQNNLQPYAPLGIDKIKLIKNIQTNISFERGFYSKNQTFHKIAFTRKEESYYYRKHQGVVSKYFLIKSIW